MYSLVNIIFDGQQVIGHSLEGELMQDRRDRVESPVQNNELRASLVWTLERERKSTLASCSPQDIFRLTKPPTNIIMWAGMKQLKFLSMEVLKSFQRKNYILVQIMQRKIFFFFGIT